MIELEVNNPLLRGRYDDYYSAFFARHISFYVAHLSKNAMALRLCYVFRKTYRKFRSLIREKRAITKHIARIQEVALKNIAEFRTR